MDLKTAGLTLMIKRSTHCDINRSETQSTVNSRKKKVPIMTSNFVFFFFLLFHSVKCTNNIIKSGVLLMLETMIAD